MEEFLFKSSISLIILYAVYFYIHRKETDHHLNRILGLACIVFAVAISLVSVENLYTIEEYRNNVYTVLSATDTVHEGLSHTQDNNSIKMHVMIYIIGCILLTLRFMFGLATLTYYCYKGKNYHHWGFKVVTINKDVSPFTFFNILFVGNRFRKNDGLDAMLVHEQVHRNQYHSIDVLILEMLTILFWFNPAIWLFQRSIRATHEYQADQEVLRKGFALLDYQHLLFESKVGVSIQLGSYLSTKVNLSKRLKMMNKPNISSSKRYLRLLVFLPALVAITGLSSFIFSGNQIDTPAVYKSGTRVMYQTLGQSIIYPKSAKEANQSGLIYVSFTVSEKGEVTNVVSQNNKGTSLEQMVVVGYSKSYQPAKGGNGELENEAVRAVKNLGNFIPAKKDNTPVSSVLTLPIKFLLK